MLAKLYAKGNLGVPTNVLAARLQTVNEIAYTHGAFWGPISATIRFPGTLEDAVEAAEQWLGNDTKIEDDDTDLQWNGLVWSVKFSVGKRSRRRSLDGYANYVRNIFTNVSFATNPPMTGSALPPAVAQDADGQARYGVIEYTVKGGQQTSVTSQALADRTLLDRKRLLYSPESSGRAGEIEIGCVGWYRTLYYLAYTASTVNQADVRIVVQNIIAAKAPMIPNDFSQMQTTGTNAPQQYDQYETAADIIKRIVGTTSGSTAGYTFGLGLDRVPFLRPSNRLATVPTYYERADGVITDSAGGVIDPWRVRPDAILRQRELVTATLPAGVALDDLANIYLAETTWSSRSGLSYKAAVSGVNGAIIP